MNILHITPHFGTGVGAVLQNYFLNEKKNKHFIISLDYINKYSKYILNKSKVNYFENAYKKKDKIFHLIKKFDLVLIHWWNHPLLSHLIYCYKWPECRLLIWSHISGTTAPNNYTKNLFFFADQFIFTTPLSFNINLVKKINPLLKKKIKTVWSTGGYQRLNKLVKKKLKNQINIGYVGNLDFSKCYKNIIKLFDKVADNKTIFTIIGGPKNQKIISDIKKSKFRKHYNLLGYVTENEKWKNLVKFDIFAYPLAKHHFGSCDLALQEAIILGIPQVVKNNSMENYIVNNKITGLVSKNDSEFVSNVKKLKDNITLRKKYSENSKKIGRKRFNIKTMCEEFDIIFKQTIRMKKKSKIYNKILLKQDAEMFEVFVESVGSKKRHFVNFFSKNIKKKNKSKDFLKKLFKNDNWSSKTKSSPIQFSNFFKKDKKLKEIKNFIYRNK